MAGERVRRPSVVVVATAVVVISTFVWRGDLRVAPSAPAGGASPTDAMVVARAEQPVVVRTQLPPRAEAVPTVRLRGRVFDTAGFLVVGAEVQGGSVLARTDADGVFELEVGKRGVVDLEVVASGYRPTTCRVAIASPDEPVCVLAPAAPWDVPALPAAAPASAPAPGLFGEGMLRTAQGAPVTGAFVMVAGTDCWSRTDDIGRYVVALPGSPVTLLVHDPAGNDGRGRALRSEPLSLERTRGTVPLPELEPGPAVSLRGTLRDARGNPAVGVPVRIRGEGMSRLLESGQSGAFRLAGLVPGRYEVAPLAFRGALGRRQQVVVDQPVVDCEVRMHATQDLRVRVLDETGAPMARAYVATAFDGDRRSVAQADADGYAAMRLVDADTQFEVREGATFTDRPVRRFEVETATLVVAAP
jgi:hypothetical protein